MIHKRQSLRDIIHAQEHLKQAQNEPQEAEIHVKMALGILSVAIEREAKRTRQND